MRGFESWWIGSSKKKNGTGSARRGMKKMRKEGAGK